VCLLRGTKQLIFVFKAVPRLRRLLACLSPRRPGFLYQVSPCDTAVLGQVFLRIRRFFPCQYHSSNVPYSTPSPFSYQKDKRTKPGNLQKKQCSFGNQGALDRQEFSHTCDFRLPSWCKRDHLHSSGKLRSVDW
jgi:hypothetical protein